MWGVVSSIALACGGPDAMPLDDALRPPEDHVEAALVGFDGYEVAYAPVTRFLHALGPTLPPAAAPPTLDTFHAGLRWGDRAAVHAAAAAVVEELLDLPARLATPHADLLRPAVEYLELEPQLGALSPNDLAAAFTGGVIRPEILRRSAEVRGLPPAEAAGLLARSPDHPRRASLEWLVLRDHVRTRIPDGWSASEIAAATPPGVREELLAEADRWLAAWPGHPLADHVRLAKVRILHLTGDGGAAWPILVDLYARHPARAAEEMRFLLLADQVPDGLDPRGLPPELAVALAGHLPLDGDTWGELWRHAEAEGSIEQQERLLLVLAREDGPLPDAFPAAAAAPSETWALLRLGALARRNHRAAAWAQSELLPGHPGVAPIRAWIRLQKGDWAGAIREPGLDPAAASYLLRVLAPDEVVEALVDDPALGPEARLVLALRRREGPRGWKRGAKLLEPTDPARAELWREGGALDAARGPESRLVYARFLLEHAGAIFAGRGGEEVVWYRSLPIRGPGEAPPRAPDLPFDERGEWAATRRWLTSAFATWEALQAYAAWLDLPSGARGETSPRRVVDEADAAYNALLNYGSFDDFAWRAIVVDSEAARTVRRAGREVNTSP